MCLVAKVSPYKCSVSQRTFQIINMLRSTAIKNCVALLAALVSVQVLLPGCSASCSLTSSAVVSALLPLHTGNNCSQLQLRGLQQLAALRAAVNEVNNEMKAQDGLTIGLQVQDTCSTPDGAMRGALRTLVETQQSCANPPLYLGMLGPEDVESLGKVKGVSKVFNTTHVLPHFLPAKESEDESVFFVSIERVKEQAESVTTLMKQLNWHSFSLAFDDSLTELAEALIQSTKDNSSLCVRGVVNRLNPLSPVPNIFTGGQSVDGVVVLADSAQMAARVLKTYQALTTPLILFVHKVGLEAWQVPRSATKMYLLQQVSVSTEGVPEGMNTTLKAEYESQKQAEFQNIHCNDLANAADCALESSTQDNLLENTDVSVTALANSVRLVASALKAVHRSRCLSGSPPTYGMCPKLMALPAHEWRNALRRATATTKHADNNRVRFLMELPTHFSVYSRDNNAGNLVQVATLAGGSVKDLTTGYSFPAKSNSASSSPCGATPEIPAALPPPHTPTTTFQDTHSPKLKELYSSDYTLYEMIGMICGVGFAMFAIMTVMIYLIYNNLVDKVEKESTGGSLETVRSSRPAQRPARRLRDTFRRNSSTRESNRS